jgi:RNA polymerase sigma-70 factor (ECF subfamily)
MDTENRIESLLFAGDLRAAATLSIEAYGPEMLGFLVTFLRDEDDANEVFSQACEDLWMGLSHFERRSSVRTWFYTLARHAASRFRRSPCMDRRRHEALGAITDVANAVRSRTAPYLRTDVKDRFAAIRNELDEDDRALLVLRVDRELSFRDIARIFADGAPSDAELAKVGARLRKRFQLIKDAIRRRARESGLLLDDAP